MVLIGLISLAAFSAEAKLPLIGDPAPPFSGRDSSGKMIYSSDYFGPNRPKNNGPARQAVLLMFSSKGCPPCERMLPALVRFYQTWNPAGVELLMIRHLEKPRELQAYQQKHKILFPVISDLYGKFYQDYGVIGFPEIFILDSKGIIRQIIIGEDTNLNQTLELEMKKMGITTQPNPGGGNK